MQPQAVRSKPAHQLKAASPLQQMVGCHRHAVAIIPLPAENKRACRALPTRQGNYRHQAFLLTAGTHRTVCRLGFDDDSLCFQGMDRLTRPLTQLGLADQHSVTATGSKAFHQFNKDRKRGHATMDSSSARGCSSSSFNSIPDAASMSRNRKPISSYLSEQELG